MTVKDLFAKLAEAPLDAEVFHYDGGGYKLTKTAGVKLLVQKPHYLKAAITADEKVVGFEGFVIEG